MFGIRRSGSLKVMGAVAAVIGFAALQLHAAEEGAAPKGVLYKGTFSDSAGRKGPLQCRVTPGEDGQWTLAFEGKNEGSGPQRPYDCSFSVTGEKSGDATKLSGKPNLGRTGTYDVTITMTGAAFEGTFEKDGGKGNGSFSMTPGSSSP